MVQHPLIGRVIDYSEIFDHPLDWKQRASSGAFKNFDEAKRRVDKVSIVGSIMVVFFIRG
jgi:hypothetical protein